MKDTSKNSALGSKGSSMKFDPNELHLVGYGTVIHQANDGDVPTKQEEAADATVARVHKLYDPRVHKPVNDRLVKSILYRGFRGAITVWKDPATGFYCVVDGRQRVKACRAANKIRLEMGELPFEVHAIVHIGSIESAMDVMGILNHGSVPLTSVQRAVLVQRYFDEGHDEEQVATILSCSVASVKNYKALLECIPEVRDAVEKKQVPFTVGFPMSKLSPSEQKEKLGVMLAVLPSSASGGDMHEDAAQAGTPAGTPAGKERAKRGTGKKQREATGQLSKRGKRELTKMLNERPEWRNAISWALGGPEMPSVPTKAEVLLKDIGEITNEGGDAGQIILIVREAVAEFFRPAIEQTVVQSPPVAEAPPAAPSPPVAAAPSPPPVTPATKKAKGSKATEVKKGKKRKAA